MNQELEAVLEAILFSAAEPVTLEELEENLACSREEIERGLEDLSRHYQEENHGLKIKSFQEGFLLCTAPRLADSVEEVLTASRSVSLSEAALETLAIVAYFQPITRNEIEEIRGVRADATLNTLQKHDLIQEEGRRDQPGRPIEYGTTENFLYFFGISDLSQLPARGEVMERLSARGGGSSSSSSDAGSGSGCDGEAEAGKG